MEIRYRPEIDGLRAIAVIPVILFHMGFQWIPGGFIGVDVFFVISGFLITSIILQDVGQERFSYSDFWLRRIRRILPALMVMVFTISIVGSIVLYAPQISNLGEHGLAALLSLANIDFWLHAGNYWGASAKDSPFLHTWTLSVEEQFYLFFPFLLILLLRYFKPNAGLIVFLLSIISVSIFFYGTQFHPDATFYLLPTRAWELGSGALLGILSFNHPLRLQNKSFLAFIGLILVILSYAMIDGEQGIPPVLIIPVIGAVLVIAFTKDQTSLTNQLLALPALVYIGKLSYSLYLWHWPILVFMKNEFPKSGSLLLSLYSTPIILLVSIFSYHFIEKTTRRNSRVLPSILVFLTVSIAYSSYLFVVDHSEDISIYSKTAWYGRLYNNEPFSEHNLIRNRANAKRMAGISMPMRDLSDSNTYATGGVIKRYGQETPDIVMLGDSHANALAGVVDIISRELGLTVSFYASGGTSPFFNIPVTKGSKTGKFSASEKFTFNKMTLHYLNVWRPKVVIIASKWSDRNEQETQDLMVFLGKIGTKVVLLEDPPELFFGDKNAPQYLAYMRVLPSNKSKKFILSSASTDYKHGRELVRRLSNKYKFCDFIPVADLFLKGNRVWVLDGSDVLYMDDDHLSQSGAMKLKNRIEQKIHSYL